MILLPVSMRLRTTSCFPLQSPKKEASAGAQRPQRVTQRSFSLLSRKEVTSITFHERKLTTIRNSPKEQA